MINTHTVSATMPRLLCFLCFFLCLQLLSSAARGGGHHDGDLKAKPLIVVKIWCLILVFIGTFISGMSPYFLKWNEGFLVLGTQFAGGVFLGNGLMHFLSDANETFEDLTSKTYPFAFMLACAGYLVTMLADSVISYVYGKGRSGGNDGNVKLEVEGGNIELEKRSPNNGSSQSHVQMHSGGGHEHTITSARSFGDSILLILALCFHSFFEGIAIGVAQSESDAWKSLWIISLHKMFAAIAMGISLLQLIPDRPFASCVTYAFAFAISSPIGVAVGIVIDATSQGLVADWTFAISMGIACGVFVYVSINHLLAKGYIPQSKVYVDTPHYRFLAVLLGIGVIALAMIWDT